MLVFQILSEKVGACILLSNLFVVIEDSVFPLPLTGFSGCLVCLTKLFFFLDVELKKWEGSSAAIVGLTVGDKGTQNNNKKEEKKTSTKTFCEFNI